MSKNTIIKIGLAGGIYNLLALLFMSLIAEMHIRSLMRVSGIMMQKYGPLGYKLSFFGILNGCFWAFVIGFIQFGAIALIFNILSTKNIVSKTINRWLKSSEE